MKIQGMKSSILGGDSVNYWEFEPPHLHKDYSQQRQTRLIETFDMFFRAFDSFKIKSNLKLNGWG